MWIIYAVMIQTERTACVTSYINTSTVFLHLQVSLAFVFFSNE
ncbi:MAG: hypothetical protein ACP5UA_01315 [Candidatus Hydrogenedens sp.]